MKKVKEWIKDHKEEVILITVSTTLGAIGGIYLYKYVNRNTFKRNEIAATICDTLLPAMKDACGAYLYEENTSGRTVKDCPKIVEGLLDCDFVNPDEVITGIAVFRKKSE